MGLGSPIELLHLATRNVAPNVGMLGAFLDASMHSIFRAKGWNPSDVVSGCQSKLPTVPGRPD